MPAKKASKPKRKSSSSTLTKYSRSRPLGPELKWFDVNTPNSIVGFGLATLIQALNIVPSGTGPNQRIGRTIVVKEIEIKINMQAAWAYVGATVPSAAGISYRVDLILDKQANGAVPLGADIYDTLVAGVSPENRFMNLLNGDRFSLVKRWEGDINPPSFIITRRDRLYTDCWSRSEAEEEVQHSCRAHPNAALPSLMLSPTTCCWSSLHPIKTLVVHSELKSSAPPTLRIRFQDA